MLAIVSASQFVGVAIFLSVGSAKVLGQVPSSDPPPIDSPSLAGKSNQMVVKVSDIGLTAAIRQSKETLKQFVATFQQRQRSQTDFVVVVLEKHDKSYSPVGILVEEINEERFSGRRVNNDLSAVPSSPLSCEHSEIIDWRYVDTLEMVGGAAYKELYKRQHRRVQFTIRDVQPFLIQRENEIADDVLKLFRDVANGRVDSVRELSAKRLNDLNEYMPVLTYGSGRRVSSVSVTVPQYAAMYGDREMIDLLFSMDVLRLKPDGLPAALVDSAYAGNLGTTKRLFELGFDIEARDELGDTALLQAASWNHLDLVRYLLEHGADPNCRDVSEETPIFRTTSVAVVEALLSAGADVNAVDDLGRTCLSGHLQHGRTTIVRLLVKSGIRIDLRGERVQETNVDGEIAILEQLKSTNDKETMKEYRIAKSVDFGSVLPIKTLSAD